MPHRTCKSHRTYLVEGCWGHINRHAQHSFSRVGDWCLVVVRDFILSQFLPTREQVRRLSPSSERLIKSKDWLRTSLLSSSATSIIFRQDLETKVSGYILAFSSHAIVARRVNGNDLLTEEKHLSFIGTVETLQKECEDRIVKPFLYSLFSVGKNILALFVAVNTRKSNIF